MSIESGPEKGMRVRTPARIAGALAVALLAAASTWFYMDRVLIPYQINDARQNERPRGNLSDLYPRWLGTRALLLEKRDPYSSEVTKDIQIGYYGRVLDPSHKGDPSDQQGFAYPAYVVFLLAPTVNLPFSEVQQGFNVVLWLLTGGSVLLWLRALSWRPPGATIALFLILTLGSIPTAQGIKLQQLSLLVSALLAGSAALVAGGYLIPGGVLLAFATIKPQLTWIPAGWLMLWVVHDWRHRRKLALSFSITMVLLVGGAEWALPGWIGRFWIAIQNYRLYTHNMSVLEWLLTPAIGSGIAIGLVILVAWRGWTSLRTPAQSAEFAFAFALIVGLAVLIVPMIAPYNQLLLLPGIMVLAQEASALWRSGRVTRLLCVIAIAVLLWPWAATLALMTASAVVPSATLQSQWKLPFYTTLTLPMFVFALQLLAGKLGIYAAHHDDSERASTGRAAS